MRLLFAARFRDLNLLISDQITTDSQLLFHRSHRDRLAMIAPFLRFDKDPYLVIDGSRPARLHPGRVHDVATGSRTPSRSTRPRSTRHGPRQRLVQLHPEQRQDHHGRLRRHDALLRRDPTDPIIRAYEGVFPTLFEPLSAMPADLQAHLRVPEDLFNVQTRMFGRYHVTDPQQFFRKDDLWTVPTGTGERADPAVRGLLRRDAPAGRDGRRVPAPPADGPDQPAEHDRVGRRPERRAELRPGRGSTDSRRTRRSSGPPRSRRGSTRTRSSAPRSRSGTSPGSKVIRGNLIVVPLDDSLIYLQPIYLQSTGSRVPGVRADRRRLATPGRLGPTRSAARCNSCSPPRPASPTPTADADARAVARPGRRRRPRRPVRQQPDADPGAGLPTDVPGPRSPTPTTTSSWPSRPSATATSRATASEIALVQAALQRLAGPRPGSRDPEPGSVRQPRAVNRGAALIGALLATLGHPATWPLALATFLIRGGIVLVAGADRRAADAGRDRQRLRPGVDVDRVRVRLGRAGRHGRRRRCSPSSPGWWSAGWLAAALEVGGHPDRRRR